MTIKPRTAFDIISQRIIYGLNFMYSEFVPIESEKADEQGQKKLHRLMGQMICSLKFKTTAWKTVMSKT